MEQKREVVIIGGGVAGSTVALYLARAGHKPLLITNDEIGGNLNQIDTIENFVGIHNAKGVEVAENIKNQLEDSGLVFETDILEDVDALEVRVSLNGNKKEYYTSYVDMTGDIHEVVSDYTVIATGQEYMELENLPENIYQNHCVLCDGFMYQGKNVVVIGGGNSALTEALELSKIVNKVYLVTRRQEFRAEKILQDRVAQTENIFHSVGNLLFVNENHYTFDTHTLIADGLFVYIGTKPNNDLLVDVELDEDGYVDTFNNKVTIGVDGSRHVELLDSYYAVGDINGSISAKQFSIAIGQATVVATELIKKLS